MKIEGTSSLHDWQSVSTVILGFLEVGPNFPKEPGQSVAPGKVEGRGEAAVKVLSFRSVKEDEKTHYSDDMDEKMYNMMKYTNFPFIVFRFNELELKEAPKDKSAPYVLEAKGDLAVAGVTNKFSMTVNVLPLGEVNGEKRLKITGEIPLKMSSFGMEPAVLLIKVKTGDDVKAKFAWIVGQNKTPAPK
jgi:hypothetical protein